jgi:large subunit ribosomal protein L4
MTRLYWPNGQTKHLAQKIDLLGLRKTLFVTGEPVVHDGLQRAIKNIPLVKLTTAEDLDVYEILKWQRLILDIKAVEHLERKLKKDNVPVASAPILEVEEETRPLPQALIQEAVAKQASFAGDTGPETVSFAQLS